MCVSYVLLLFMVVINVQNLIYLNKKNKDSFIFYNISPPVTLLSNETATERWLTYLLRRMQSHFSMDATICACKRHSGSQENDDAGSGRIGQFFGEAAQALQTETASEEGTDHLAQLA